MALHGARLALKTLNQALTYDQLNRAANRLGRAILTGSPAGDEPIALLFKHGSALITANLAVLKTGRPFVQIDDKLPQARAARLIEDAGARAIVTDSEHYRCARELAGGDAIVVNLDTLKDDLADSNLGLAIAPSAIAYINYTSGSTGEPKGVMSDHGSELHSILVKAKALAITPSDRISLLRSHNVGATSDALLGLLNGAALCLLELKEEGLAGLADWLIGEQVTVFTCVASVFRHALRNLDRNATFPGVRLVHLGGEALFQSDIELFKQHFIDGCRLVNRLGISETKTASYFFIDKNSIVEEPVVPVGFALDGYEIAVLDEAGKPVAANIVGEIAVKSRFLASGYWRRPELTQAKFLTDPAGSDARIFLSGDLGYLRPDGCLVHAGRKDLQTKIRGHRVELAEVEIALLEIAGIEQAAVVARQQRDGSARLLAYVVLRAGTAHERESNPRRVARKIARLHDSRRVCSIGTPADDPQRQNRPAWVAGGAPFARRPRCSLCRAAEPTGDCLGAALVRGLAVGRNWAALTISSPLAATRYWPTRIVARVNQMFALTQPLKTLFATPTVAQLAAWITAQERSPGAAAESARLMLEIDGMTPEQIYRALGDD